jgi:hypothetical protein
MKGNFKSGPGSRQGRPCVVCRHADCRRIELAIADGRSHNDVAAEYGLSRFAINRHWMHHVTPVQKAQFLGAPIEISKLVERAAKEDRSLIEYLTIVRSELLRLFMQARDAGMVVEASRIAQSLLSCLESIGKVNGQLRQAGITINNVNAGTVGNVSSGPALILGDPQVVRLQSTIIRALARHPEARADVIEALRSLEPRPNGHADPVGLLAPVIGVEAANA